MTRRVAGVVGMAAVVASAALMAAGAASAHGVYTPGRLMRWPSWLESPLAGLHMQMSVQGFQALTLVMAGGFALALVAGRALPVRALVVAIVAAHVALLLGPPLLSRDVVGYLGYARLGVVHGLDPYSHVAAEAPGDPLYPFSSWPREHTPYGPLFTIVSYAFAPLGLAGGIWALKALAALASLGAVALIARAAGALGHSARGAAAFVGLNPALLELTVGGDHNDTLVLLLLAAGLAALAATPARVRSGTAALVAAAAVKVSAGIALPFLLLRRDPGLGSRARLRVLVVAACGAALVLACTFAVFGVGPDALVLSGREELRLLTPYSIPTETAHVVGLHGVPVWWRQAFAGVFVLVTVVALVLTARGASWLTCTGWALVAMVVSAGWLVPWYAVWPLPFAALSKSRALRAATLALCAYALLLHLPLAKTLLGSPHLARQPLTEVSRGALRGGAGG